MAELPNLARVVADAEPVRAINGIMERAETDMRAQLRQAAEQQALRQRQREAARPRVSRGHGRPKIASTA